MKSKACRRDKKTGIGFAVPVIFALMMTFVMSFGCFTGIGWTADNDKYFFGSSEEHSTFNKESGSLKDSFYFSDSWFDKDPSVRNDELALVSMQLTAAAVKGGADSPGSAFLKDMGFSDIAFADKAASDSEACNYTHGSKTLPDGRKLVAVVIQSYSEDSGVKEQGWKQNFTVNGSSSASGEHFAFARAVDKVIGDISALGSSNTVFWVMGQSRGGALANLIAKELGNKGQEVFAYTFEAPAMVDAGAVSGNYGYIHNYLCRDDIVTKVPMWGMTRYGSTYELKTEETDDNIQEELKKLGSEAAGEDVPDSEWIETDVIDYLNERIAARADYSKEHSDSFTDADTGEEVTLTYSYQDTFVKLMGVIFGGGMSGISDAILGNTEALEPAVKDLVEAVKRDGTDEAMPYYYDAAKKLLSILEGAAGKPVDLTVKDLYALLTLAGPFAVDKDYEPIDDPSSNVMGYMSPAVNVAMSAGGMTYSHHFDTLIARLKTLAPAPKMEDVNITIDEPKAGDDVSKAPSEVEEFFDEYTFKDAGKTPWIAVEAYWDTEDKKLQDDSIYYLDITLETVGHTIPEDISLKLNGKSPAKGPFISYDESTGITRVTFEFEIGEPPEIEVSFNTGGKTDNPKLMKVKKGTALSTVERPEISEIVTFEGAKFKLKDWYDSDDSEGKAWDDVKVSEPVTMYAKWLDYIDLLEISFDVPSLGDGIAEATIPEDAPYCILLQECWDPGYENTTEASREGEYSLNLNIALKEPDKSVFALETDEWGYLSYTGKVTVNGEEVAEPTTYDGLYYGLTCEYDESGPYLRVSYYFPVSAEDNVTYTFKEGAGQTWTKGSDKEAEFVIKRSAGDEETFKRFKEIKVDGKTVSEDAYSAEQGSLILNIEPSYLEELSEGSHTLMAEFDDGNAEADFIIKAADGDNESAAAGGDEDKPAKTGDENDILTWMLLMAASLLTLAGLRITKKSSR